MLLRWIVRREPAFRQLRRQPDATATRISAWLIALLLIVSAFLFAACTQPLVIAANPADAGEATILGEPVVIYNGEPIVLPMVMSGTSAESPLATPQAEPQSEDAAAQTIPSVQDAVTEDAGSVTGTPRVGDPVAEATTQPDASLDDLLDEPIGESPIATPVAESAQGGLAGAAHASAEATTVNTTTAAAVLAELLAQSAAPVSAAPVSSTIPSTSADVQPARTPPPSALAEAPPSAPIPDGAARTLRVPILMYHYLSAPPANADIYRKDLSVTPDLFAEHLDRMQAEGFTPITLYALTQALMQGAPLPEQPVIITFDDGYRDNYENAFPLLRERGMTATFFVLTDVIDNEQDGYMTWDMAREMLAAGMSIESHGRNHATLEGRDDDYLIWQALGSMETIAFELGVRPRYISYPAGEYDENTMRIFASAGYWGGATTIQGAQQDNAEPFEMVRIRVRATTSADDLIRLLRTDW